MYRLSQCNPSTMNYIESPCRMKFEISHTYMIFFKVQKFGAYTFYLQDYSKMVQ